jgi:hypothetical protein
LSFASTTHKIQGQTITAPSKVAVDLTSVFGPNQAYVMLGRVQERNQIYIIGSLPENKITTDEEALNQLAVLKAKSVNRNPPVWEKTFGKSYKIFFHNIHSLRDKIEDVKADLLLPFADLIIFGETWLETTEGDEETLPAFCQPINKDTDQSLPALCQPIKKVTDHKDGDNNTENAFLPLKGYKLHLNSFGRGKGLASYFKEDKFKHKLDITNEDLQMTIFESENLSVISLYRSNSDGSLRQLLLEMIPAAGTCLVIGDFNICTRRTPNHEVFITLKSLGFKPLVTEATHFDGGHLDQAWLRVMLSIQDVYTMELYSPYYNCKDHDALMFSFFDPKTEQGKNVHF